MIYILKSLQVKITHLVNHKRKKRIFRPKPYTDQHSLFKKCISHLGTFVGNNDIISVAGAYI